MVVEVNRAVAAAMALGARVGLKRLLNLSPQADKFYPYHVARAYLLRHTGQREVAAKAAERAYLQRQRSEMLKLGA